jgi:VCBS repeat-containing protein
MSIIVGQLDDSYFSDPQSSTYFFSTGNVAVDLGAGLQGALEDVTIEKDPNSAFVSNPWIIAIYAYTDNTYTTPATWVAGNTWNGQQTNLVQEPTASSVDSLHWTAFFTDPSHESDLDGSSPITFNPNYFYQLVISDNGWDVGTFGSSTLGLPYFAVESADVINPALVADNIAVNANEDTNPRPVTLTASYTDADLSHTHMFSVDTTGTKGTIVNNGDGTFTYNPNGKFEYLGAAETATDTFSYTVTDGHGASSTATATVNIHGENDAPTVSAVITSIKSEDDASYAINLLQYASDPDQHDVLHVSNVTGLIAGVTLTGDTLVVDPNVYNALAVGEHAAIDVSYNILDGNGGSVSETASITINGLNDAPTAAAVSTIDQKGQTVSGNVLANDSDPDTNDVLHVSNVDGLAANIGISVSGTYGTLLLNANGSYTYKETQPLKSAASTGAIDSFTFTINDGHPGGDATSTLTFVIGAGAPSLSQPAPVLVNDAIAVSDQAKQHYKPHEIAQGNRSDPTDPGNDHGTRTLPIDNIHLQWAYDFVVNDFTPVHAVAAGTVVYVYDGFQNSQSFVGYGNIVTVMSTINGETFYTTYAHLAGLDGLSKGMADPIANLTIGASVSSNQIIALSGDTGTLSDGALHPQLHVQFGTELYSANLENGVVSTVAQSGITYNHGAIADGENDAVAPAYFQQLYMNLNNHENRTDKFYTGIEGSDHFVANAIGDTIVTNGGADDITLDALTQSGRDANHIELYGGASLVADIDPIAAATLPGGVVPSRAGSIVDMHDLGQGGFWGLSGAAAPFGGLAPNQGTSSDMSAVSNFQAGLAPGGDVLDFSVSAWGSGGLNSLGGLNHGLTTGNLSAVNAVVATGTGATVQPVNSGQTILSATNLVELLDTFADANSAIAGIHSGSDKVILSAALPDKDDAHMLVAYQDPAGNAHIMDAEFVNTSGSATADSTHMTEYGSDMIQLTGVSLSNLTGDHIHFVG